MKQASPLIWRETERSEIKFSLPSRTLHNYQHPVVKTIEVWDKIDSKKTVFFSKAHCMKRKDVLANKVASNTERAADICAKCWLCSLCDNLLHSSCECKRLHDKTQFLQDWGEQHFETFLKHVRHAKKKKKNPLCITNTINK